MSLSIGIVGLPNVGKSTLFQALTKHPVDCSNYPFCTINPNVGVVAVPDERLDKLTELLKPEKKIQTTVEFLDVAGLIKGASRGEGLGNQFLGEIRETNALLYVLRCFGNEKIINTRNVISPISEKEVLDVELSLKDLATVEKRLLGLEKEVRAGNKAAEKEVQVLRKAAEALKQGELLASEGWEEEERQTINNYQLLTLKPCLYVLNGSESEAKEFEGAFQENNWPYLIIDVLTECEAAGFSVEERKDFGLPEQNSLDILIKECYVLLGLITFFSKESSQVRAWTVKAGSKAPQAGGVIHSDFENYFISAEVIDSEELLRAGGIHEAREQGLLRQEGKGYVVQDGDVIEIKSSR